MTLLRRTALATGLACGVFLAVGAAHAQADKFPSKPIRLIVPYGTGSGTDNSARYFTQKIAEKTGWTFLIENKPGGNGFIGLGEVQRSPADGYTMVYTGGTTHGVNSALFKKLPYDPLKDFTPVTPGVFSPMVLLAKPDLNVKTAAELVDVIRKNPGKMAGATGSSFQIMAMEVFKHENKLETTNVPYKGSAQSMTDLLGGHVDFTLVDLAAGLPQIEAGRLKALAVTSPARVDVLPDVPTMAQAGLPDIRLAGWAALFVKAGTPEPVVATLQKAFNGYFQSPDYKAYVGRTGGYYTAMSTPEMMSFITTEIERSKAALQRAGIQPE